MLCTAVAGAFESRTSAQSADPAIIVLDPAGVSSLSMGGSAGVRLPGSGVHVNSSSPMAVHLAGSSILEAQYLNITTTSVPDVSHFIGVLNTERPALADPLLALVEPVPGAPVQTATVIVTVETTLTLNPGFYPGGINVRGNLLMNPGVYILDGDFSANSQARINGEGVVVFLRGAANLDFSSDNMTFQLSPPSAGPYQGIGIFQQRGNTATSSLAVSASSRPQGTIYMPSSQLNITASGTIASVARFVVNRLNVTGSGSFTVIVCGTPDFNGDGDFGTDADIEAFFACLGGNCCATCFAGGPDFNGDGDFGTDADIESFFRVLAGGAC